MEEKKARIRQFIESNMVIYDDEVTFGDGDNIFELGFVDSMFALQLVRYVEQEFGVKVTNADIQLKNFSSVDAVLGFVNTKLESAA